MQYLHPNDSPTEHRAAALQELASTIARLREVADTLENFSAGDIAQMEKHGDEYARHAQSKTTFIQRVQAANDDVARAQKILFDAVAQAVQA